MKKASQKLGSIKLVEPINEKIQAPTGKTQKQKTQKKNTKKQVDKNTGTKTQKKKTKIVELLFIDGKINKLYIDTIKNENLKILYQEYIKICKILKKEKNDILQIQKEKVAYDKMLQFIQNFEGELKKKNTKDIKRLNMYFLNCNLGRLKKYEIKNENDTISNVFGKNINYELTWLEKFNNKFIIDYLRKNEPLKMDKIEAYSQKIDLLNSEYLATMTSKRDYIKKNSARINNASTRIINNYLKKNDTRDINPIKEKLKEYFLKDILIINRLKKIYEKQYKNYNRQYTKYYNCMKYNIKRLKDKYSYLFSE